MKAPRLVLYPFLAAVYPILALAATNDGELVQLSDLVKPCMIALSAAALAWLLSRLVTRDIHRRALVTVVAVGIFSGYGYGAEFLGRWPLAETATPVLMFLPLAYAILFARRVHVSLLPLTRYLNIVVAILVTWMSGSFLWRLRPMNRPLTFRDIPTQRHSARDIGADTRPHFFLIVLDKYTGHRSLVTNYGFDNTPFEHKLEEEGFFVPRAARANYVHTFLALAAMLNWQYLDDVAKQLGRENTSWVVAYPLIEDNRTWRALRRLGYRFAFLPSALPATAHNQYADIQLPDPSQLTHEFEAVWLRGTVLSPTLRLVCALRLAWEDFACSEGALPYVPESATSLDWKFQAIPSLARSKQPVFVLAHLTVPHEPYLYDAQCHHRDPYWPSTDSGSQALAVKAAYGAQLQCINRKVEQLVKAIPQESTRPSIILLQSDHGHGRLGRDQPALTDATKAQVDERVDVFAAYLLPNAPLGLVYDSISPVNAMRAIMRHYYGFDLPPLVDASYWSSSQRPYHFTRIR